LRDFGLVALAGPWGALLVGGYPQPTRTLEKAPAPNQGVAR